MLSWMLSIKIGISIWSIKDSRSLKNCFFQISRIACKGNEVILVIFIPVLFLTYLSHYDNSSLWNTPDCSCLVFLPGYWFIYWKIAWLNLTGLQLDVAIIFYFQLKWRPKRRKLQPFYRKLSIKTGSSKSFVARRPNSSVISSSSGRLFKKRCIRINRPYPSRRLMRTN